MEKRTDFKFNFNDQVKVRLKQTGVDILRQQHEELDKHIKSRTGNGLGEFTIKIDDDGYTSFQLWRLMQRFGEYMTLGSEPPFHGDMIMCGGKPLPNGENTGG